MKFFPYFSISFHTLYCIFTYFQCCHSFDNSTESIKDDLYKVYRVLPNNLDNLKALYKIWISALNYDLNFWSDPRGIGIPCDVMVSEKFQIKLETLFDEYNLTYIIWIEDVEKLILEREHNRNYENWRKNVRYDYYSNIPQFDFFRYHSYNEIMNHMTRLQSRYPNIAQVFTIGVTHERRLIRTIKIGNPLDSSEKRSIWIDAGMHAREWVSHSTAVYFMHMLTTRYEYDREIKNLVDSFTWYITPIANPDGYEYSRSSTKPAVRFWRKNRSPSYETCQYNNKNCCYGVDLNRNFDFHWSELGSSWDPCSEDYHGKRAFSERESEAISNFLTFHREKFDAFISLHSYAQYWLFPYGHQNWAYTYDFKDLRKVAINATKALSYKFGTSYKVGTGADLLYPATGGSDDWAKAKMRIKFVYLIELRPGDKVPHGFIYDPRFLRDVGEETWEGVKVVAHAVGKFNEIKKRNRNKKFYGRG